MKIPILFAVTGAVCFALIINLLYYIWDATYSFIAVAIVVLGCLIADHYGYKSEKKKMQEAPRSEFIDQPMEKAPLRCIKEYSK